MPAPAAYVPGVRGGTGLLVAGTLLAGGAAVGWWLSRGPARPGLVVCGGPAGEDPLREIRRALAAVRGTGMEGASEKARLAAVLAPAIAALLARFRSDPAVARAVLDAIASEDDPNVSVAASSLLGAALSSLQEGERDARRGSLLGIVLDSGRPSKLRGAVLEALGAPRSEAERQAAIGLLSARDDPALAIRAAAFVGKALPDAPSRAALLKACRDGQPQGLRSAALAALCDAGDPEAGDECLRMFSMEADPVVRESALERAVRLVPMDRLRPALISVLKGTSPQEIRETALEALAADPHPDAREALARAAKEDPDEAIRAKAARLGGR
ncbi:MAG: HEAT repeat domain-containing protein [Planctomycetales bacterium]|nr:HEAT repeat domain-containing protein [Planctomycetales bacterium]